MKPVSRHGLLAVLSAFALATPVSAEESAATPEAAPTPAAAPDAAPPAETKPEDAAKPGDGEKKKDKKKKDKKKKDKDKDKDGKKDSDKKNEDKDKAPDGAKGGLSAEDAPKEKPSNGNWCEWLSNDPGTLYENKDNPWLQAFRIGGRFQYQVSYQDGSDVNGRDYHDTYDEYRRFRIETRTKFLRYFTMEMDANMVDDSRYDSPPGDKLSWGYDDFDTATFEFDIAKAFGAPLDDLKLVWGKMKMPITEEQRQSSKSIYTIERSLLSNKLGGAESRPTGFMLEAAKGDWSGLLGVFSGEDDSDFIGGWNDGETYFGSLTWQPDKDFSLTLDYATTHRSGSDDALGYRSAIALGSTYDKKRWGIQTSLIYGDNGFGDPTDKPKNRVNRQGDFYGAVVMPWYWLMEDRLQLVFRYEYAGSDESEGLRLGSRYIRGEHDDPVVNVNGGRGDRYNACYLGLNYYLCGDNAKIMGGILYEDLETPAGGLDAFTYTIAFRTAF